MNDTIMKDTVLTQVDAANSLTLQNTTCSQGGALLYWIIGVSLLLILFFILFIIKKKGNKSIISGNKGASPLYQSARPYGELNIPKPISPQLTDTHTPDFIVSPIIQPEISVRPSSLTTVPETVKSEPINKILEPEVQPAEQSKIKHIGYNPINIFSQTEPLSYPYVIMPKPDCVIKFPRKGRLGRKGYKEVDFKTYIQEYFKENFQVYDDRFVLTRNEIRYEPDFSLINERDGINLFIDIEIDEPYEGLNDINIRKASHYQYSDVNRNDNFKNRGWVIIRFAEIQVHQNPSSCCRFIADVVKSIHPKFNISEQLTHVDKIMQIKQWTKDEAIRWSIEKYREHYLGIDRFGTTEDNMMSQDITSTELDDQIEKEVTDEKNVVAPEVSTALNTKSAQIHAAINSERYIAFIYQNHKTIVKPVKSTEVELIAFCYVKNRECTFDISNVFDIQLKDNYCTLRLLSPALGIERTAAIMNIAIQNQKYIRMKYTRGAWTDMVNTEAEGYFMNKIEAEESIRTINDIQLSLNVLPLGNINKYHLNSNYITAYCNKRDEQRTFRFDRISEIEILDL